MRSCVKNRNIGSDRSGQTVQTKIRLLLKEQPDQSLHCMPFSLNLFYVLLHLKIKLFNFRTVTVILGVPIFRIFNLFGDIHFKCVTKCLEYSDVALYAIAF